MATLMARKSGLTDNAVATDDEHHDALASDTSVSAFPQGSSFGSTTTSSITTTTTMTDTNSFGGFNNASSAGSSSFGSTASSGFGAPSTGAASTPSFGSPTPGFGSAQPGGIGGVPGQGQVQVVQNQGESLKNTGGAMQEGADVLVKNDNADWINKKWRPVMGWVYMMTCTCDFVLFPILWSLLQALSHGQVTSQWQPLTLQGAGLYHIAMGAVLGIAAYGRTKEKVAGAA
jgi:hypothetical protein